MERAIRALLPFYVLLFAILMLVTYVPALTLFLPPLFGMQEPLTRT